MNAIDTKKPVLVTGGSGYVASWIIKKLIDQGYTVHTTVRDPKKNSSVGHLHAICSDDRLKIFQADLLDKGSFFEAMQGCEVIMHTASPFVFLDITDPQEQLIKPAVQGTENVLSSANETSTIRRIVLTSSLASIYGDISDRKNAPNRKFDETCWNTTTSAEYQPYSFSKVSAERRAWEIAETQYQWELVTINPGLVLGPALAKNSDSFSIDLLKQICDGRLFPAAIELDMAVVDVREVAQAHILAAFTESANGRYLIASEVVSIMDIASYLSSRFKRTFKYPLFTAPKPIIWLLAPIFGLERRYVKENVGHRVSVDNSRSKKLGLQYRSVEETVVDHYKEIYNVK